MKKNRVILCSGVLISAIAGSSLAANIYTKSGGITGNWSNTTSWALGAPPSSSDSAYIRYGDTITADSTVDVNQIRIFEASTLNLTNGAQITVGGGTGYTYIGGSASGAGNMTMSGGSLDTGRLYLGYNQTGVFNMSGGAITVRSQLFIGDRIGAAVTTTQTGGIITSAATDISLTQSGANSTYALNGGTLQTTDLVYRYKGASAVPFTMDGAGTLQTSGIQYLDSWGATDVTFIQAGGILDPALVDASGITSEVADLVLYNNADMVNYTMGESATLAMQVSGTNTAIEGAGGYDQISVDNTFTANGTLLVTFIDSYVASIGDVFDLLDASSFNGTFNEFDLPDLPGGLKWDTSKLLTTGSIGVVSEPVVRLHIIQ